MAENGLGNRCSILLSYGTLGPNYHILVARKPLPGAVRRASATRVVLSCPADSASSGARTLRPRLGWVSVRTDTVGGCHCVGFRARQPVLASGRTIKLLDIRLPSDENDLKRPLAWLQSLGGRRVATASIVGGGDRWGRDAGDVTLLDEPAPINMADLLVAEGFAMVDAGDRSVLCRPELLAEERRARTRRLGVWAGDRHGPVAAHDLVRLQAMIGRFALVEGVVRSVGERRERTYLNFGRDWKQDLTITIPVHLGRARAVGGGPERKAHQGARSVGRVARCRHGDHGRRHARSARPGQHTALT